jgi:hypothetical protein
LKYQRIALLRKGGPQAATLSAIKITSIYFAGARFPRFNRISSSGHPVAGICRGFRTPWSLSSTLFWPWRPASCGSGRSEFVHRALCLDHPGDDAAATAMDVAVVQFPKLQLSRS